MPTDTALTDAASLLDNQVIDRALDADFAFHSPVDTSVPVIKSATITPNPVDAGATMVIAVEIE